MNDGKIEMHKTNVGVLDNKINVKSEINMKGLSVTPSLKLGTTRTFATNNYNKKEDESGFNYAYIMNTEKSNMQIINLNLGTSIVYDIKVTNKLNIYPRAYVAYTLENSKQINTKEHEKMLKEELEGEFPPKKGSPLHKKLTKELYGENKQKIDFQMGTLLDYQILKGINMYSSVDAIFDFKESEQPKFKGITSKKLDRKEYRKLNKEKQNKMLPENLNIKAIIGMKYKF